MKHLKLYNESIRKYLKPKSVEEIKIKLLKLTPYGMFNKVLYLELGKDFEDFAQKRIDESNKELDDVFEKYSDKKDLKKLVWKIWEWVQKNGGNETNIINSGFEQLADHIVTYGGMGWGWKHDSIVIYDDKVFESFKDLLKNFVICEVLNNNKDNDEYYETFKII